VGDIPEPKSLLHTRYKAIKMFDGTGNLVEEAHPRTSPDHLVVQGMSTSGAMASISFRSVASPTGNVGFHWVITGTAGEILIESPEWFWAFDQGKASLKIRRGTATEDEVIDFVDTSGLASEIPYPMTNVGRIYDAIAGGSFDRVATFESVLETQKLLDRILKASK
jgi:predicted dehydrogenase